MVRRRDFYNPFYLLIRKIILNKKFYQIILEENKILNLIKEIGVKFSLFFCILKHNSNINILLKKFRINFKDIYQHSYYFFITIINKINLYKLLWGNYAEKIK